jgi:hypothetical protein
MIGPTRFAICFQFITINPLAPNDLQRRRAVIPLKIKIPSKNMREKSTNTPIIHSEIATHHITKTTRPSTIFYQLLLS